MNMIILPAYQPDEKLVQLADQLWRHGLGMIVVDDGSGEGYEPVFEKIQDVCIVLHHKENRGKGAAIKTALQYIKDEVWGCRTIGVMDTDGQHLAEDMLKVICRAERHPNAIVLGVRKMDGRVPWKSRAGNAITKKVFRLMSGVSISDTQTGLRAFDISMADWLLEVGGERYEYEMNVLLTAVKKRIPIEEIEIATIYHDSHNSGSHFRPFKDSIRIYGDMIKMTLSSFSSFLLDYALFSLLMLFFPRRELSVLAANILARIISASYNYTMNCHFVFNEKNSLRTAAEYFILAVGILAANNVILGILTGVVRMNPFAAKVITELMLFIMSFFTQKYLIFSKGKMKAHKGLAAE